MAHEAPVNARDARRRHAQGRGAVCPFGGDGELARIRVNADGT